LAWRERFRPYERWKVDYIYPTIDSEARIGNPASNIGYIDFSNSFTLVNNPTARLSQLALESVRRPTQPNVLVTQAPIEVVRRPSAMNMRVTQMAVEVIRRNGTPPASGSQGGMLIVVAG
jgi:hypothetical protein